MDFSPLINQTLSAILWLIPVAVLTGIFKSPGFKGYIGELRVKLAAKLLLNKDEYQSFHNVTYAGRYISYIKAQQQDVLSPSQIEHVVSVIQSGRLKPSLATHREHIRILQSKRNSESPRLCPKGHTAHLTDAR